MEELKKHLIDYQKWYDEDLLENNTLEVEEVVKKYMQYLKDKL